MLTAHHGKRGYNMPGPLFPSPLIMSYLLLPSFPVIDDLYKPRHCTNRFPVKLVKVKKALG